MSEDVSLRQTNMLFTTNKTISKIKRSEACRKMCACVCACERARSSVFVRVDVLACMSECAYASICVLVSKSVYM